MLRGGAGLIPSVTDAIELNLERIATLFTVQKISNPMQNPLYVASDNCTEELLRFVQFLFLQMKIKLLHYLVRLSSLSMHWNH